MDVEQACIYMVNVKLIVQLVNSWRWIVGW